MITKDNGTIDCYDEDEYEAFVQAAIAMEEDDMGGEEEHVLYTHDTIPSLVVTKVLTTHSHDLEDQRCNIFQTKAGIHGKSIKVIIDGGSCDNLASTELCSKLNLQLRKHAHPYHVQWLSDNGNIKIEHTVSVTFKIGAYENTVECDVAPMMVCHVLLGRPWQFDKKAIHNGYSNAYTFKEADKTLTLHPMTPSQIIADNAKALARVQQVSIPSEMSDEQPSHNKESERHKPYMSDKITHALIATKTEMRDLHHNPSTLHFVLICKGIVLTTNDHSTIPSPLLSLLKEFQDVFLDELPHGLPPLHSIEHRIDLIPDETKEIECQIHDLLQKGYVRESLSPCVIPVILVPKSDDTLRMFMDCRPINAITIQYRYPIPRLDDMLDELAGSTIFSKIELHSGYHQIRMAIGDMGTTEEVKPNFRTPPR
jgi:hypothetical protein